MVKLLIYFSKHPWLVLAGIALLSILSASQLKFLEVRISADEMLIMGNDEQKFYQQVKRTFGDEQVSLLYLEGQPLLAKDKLEVLQRVIERLETMPFVDRVESLFSVPYVKTVDGYLDKEPYLAKIPETEEAAQVLLDEAIKNPFLKHVLLSPNGKVMAVAIILSNIPDDYMDDEAITAALEWATGELEGYYQKVFSIGFPHVRTEIAERIRTEQGSLFPLAIAALLIALFLLLRQLIDILIPVLTAGFSILWTLGFMSLAGIPLNVVTSIVPILIIIVGSTEDIHLLSEFRHGQKQGFDTKGSLKHMARRMGGIVLLTFITTYAGFLSVSLSGIEVLWQFGIVSSTGLLLNFLATISLIPALLSIAGKWQLDGKSGLFEILPRERAEKYWNGLWNNRAVVITVFVFVTLTVAAGIPKIQINHNAIDSLGKDSVVAQHIGLVNENLAGLETLTIIIDSGIQDTFLKVRYLDELIKIQKHIQQQGWSQSSTSFADYLALLNAAFQEMDEPMPPMSDDVVTELMIFLHQKDVKAYVTEDFASARILVRHSVSSTEQLKIVVDDLQTFLDTELDSGLRARITGDSVLSLSATSAMINGQLQSILILLFIIVLIIAMLFTEVKVGLIAAVPNLFPVIILFGVMGYADIPLNIGTTMAAAIAIGIAVDDTLHFMLRYNRELKLEKSHRAAMRNTLHGESLPIFATSVAMIAGFLVFTLSTFEPIVQFGMLGALVIASALVADFVITPLAISSLRLITIWDVMSLRLRKRVLSKSILFKGMRPWQIRQFILSGTVEDLSRDDYIFRRGEESNDLYLLLTGKVEVCLPGPDDNSCRSLEQFAPGDVFGDVALFANHPRKADAIARMPSKVLVLSRDGFENTTRHRPGISAHIFQNLTEDISRRMLKLVVKQEKARTNMLNDSNNGKKP